MSGDGAARVVYGKSSQDGGLGSAENTITKLSQTPIIQRGVVIQTLCDPSLRLDESPESLYQGQSRLYYTAPRNSIVCRLVTDGTSEEKNQDLICYPFFSSHFSMPVKPGEQVWIFRELPIAPKGNGTYYWLSRVPENLENEDVNITSFSREAKTILSASLPVDEKRIADFPNDPSDKEDFVIAGYNDAIVKVISDAVEYTQMSVEPVPRFTNRPGDLVLQGSNNTAISLGTDRGFDAAIRPDTRVTSNSSDKVAEKSGAIDVVVGRGRYFEPDTDEAKKERKKAQAGGEKNSTKPFVVKNTLEKFETDKNPGETQDRDEESANEGFSPSDMGNPKTNPSEGDPDFLVDHIRIVARNLPTKAYENKLPPKLENVKGTIRIVKEGDPDKDLACIYIEADGTIQISGSKIFLGRQKADGGNGKGPGDGEAQPYVRYSDLEKLWQDTMTALDSFCQTLSTHVTPGYGAPSPQINQAASTLKSKVASLKTQIEEVKSERVFGE